MATQRASLKELKKFANKVRKAGGGNPLDALMPAVPLDAEQCLIAKNLNFNCQVSVTHHKGRSRWVMALADEAIRDRIAAKLKLEPGEAYETEETPYYVVLPREIAAVAQEFDKWSEAIVWPSRLSNPKLKKNAPKQLARLKEFWPYIEESRKEAYAHADFVNEKGEIVL